MAGGGNILSVVMAVILIGVMAGIGIVVVATVFDALPSLTGTANTTAEAVETGIYDAFNLLPVVLIVLVAGVIIMALFFFRGGT